MNKIVYFGMIFLTVISCKSAFVSTNESVKSNMPIMNDLENGDDFEKKPYFNSSGTEPFWGLTISEHEIVFKTIGDSIITPHIEPILAMDANVKMYRLKTESAQINIQISQHNCTNSMSGNTSPYAVSVEFKKNRTQEFEKVYGCGEYVTDYRLHDIWVLEELNGKRIGKEDFSKEFPLMEIYASTNKFSGFSGCNQMNGSLFFEKEKLLFIDLATTKMICESSNKEAEFITALQSTHAYKIENNRLILSNPSGIKLVFKKID